MLRDSCGAYCPSSVSTGAGNDSAAITVEPAAEAALQDAPSCTDTVSVPNSLIHQERLFMPLEAIFAGRKAAGCERGAFLGEDAGAPSGESVLEFLCFLISNEVYGINIMDIKEIIKPRETAEIPCAPLFISGVISLRGAIIPVIDLRVRLGFQSGEPTGRERILVIKNSTELSGLLVDEVLQVTQVPLDAVEEAPSVLDGVDHRFISGIGRMENRLMIMLDLEKIADINLY